MASKAIFIFLFILFLSSQLHSSELQTWVKAGYWNSNSVLPLQGINSALFTHLSCAFAEVNPSSYQVFVPSAAEQDISTFTTIVKRRNPSVKTLMSVWNGISATGKSIAARRYGFDGIDLFWVWPNSTDLSNIGGLLEEWRAAINSEARKPSESQLILTIGVRYLPTIEMVSYPIESISRNVDWAHVLAYDYHLPTKEKFTGLHAALYNSSSHVNTDFGIREWLKKGFPAIKLVLGLPYHGYAWRLVNSGDNDIGSPASGPAETIDGSYAYKSIKSFIQNYGYGVKAVYNSTYVASFCKIQSTWINFDDVEAIKAKVSYAKARGLLGYSAFELSNDDNWELSQAANGIGTSQPEKQQLLVIVLVTTAAAILLMGTIICYLHTKIFKSQGLFGAVQMSVSQIRKKISAQGEHEYSAPNLQVFSFTSIKAATSNFSSVNKLGEGGYGPVYKGKLPKGQEIAVKRLSKSSNQGLEEFKNEVMLTSRLQHVNLVRVLGICTEREEKMLIYEFMPNKSLDFYLYDPIRRYKLDWAKRVHIIEGVTQGLLYLQEYSNITVIHRDLKSSNILLDDAMNPKISDFGMAKLFKKDVFEANTGRIVGTYGYVPPEYVTKGIYSMKYDVYSFGVLLLQIISGKRNTCYYGPHENLNLLEYAYDLWNDDRGTEFIDPSLDDSSSPCKITRCMQIALLCVQENPEDRPTMLEVFMMLRNGSMAATTPKRPAFSVKADKNTGSTSASQQEICSFNDPQISELQPR
ncbi:hypothetical protein DITRI_Ditri10aG0123200 [Diplodiscus trichospermus]